MPDTIDDARRMIESRLAEIAVEASQIERALSHLGEGAIARPARRRRKTKGSAAPASTSGGGGRRPSRRKSAGRAPRGQRRAELLAAIEASPGARPSELAARIGIRPTQVSVLIAKARAEKLIIKSGEGYALKS